MRRGALVGLLFLLSAAGCADDPIMTSPGEPSPGAWQRLPGAPLAGRTGAGVVGVGDKAYVFGGWEFLCPPNADCAGPSEPPFADGAVVDLETGEWSRIADAPYGLVHASTAVLDDDIYALTTCRNGARCSGPPELLRYDTAADTWTELGALPAKVDGSLVPTDHGLLVVAGTEENGERDDALYDPDTARWTVLPDDPLPPSYDRFAVADGDRVLLFGSPMVEPDQEGRSKVGAAYDLVAGTWTELPTAPGPGYQVWRAGDRAFLNPHFGDAGGGVLDLRSDTWSAFPDGPDDPDWQGDLAGVVSEDGATYEYSDGWVLDARDDEWLEVPPLGGEVYDESLGAVGQALVVFGGQEWEGDDGRLVAYAWVWRPPA
jgi:hypothetical protein